MKCAFCGGKVASGLTTVSVDNGSGVVVIRGVPARICSQCGEEWILDKSAAEIEKIVQRAAKEHMQVEVVAMAGA